MVRRQEPRGVIPRSSVKAGLTDVLGAMPTLVVGMLAVSLGTRARALARLLAATKAVKGLGIRDWGIASQTEGLACSSSHCQTNPRPLIPNP